MAMPIHSLAKLGCAFLLISTAACVAGGEADDRHADDQVDWHSGGKADGQSCDFDTMSAATYYGQFAYKSFTTESGSTWYRVGLTWDVKAVLDNGDQADMNVYFLADNRVIVEYSEEHRESYDSSAVLNQTVIVTRAQIDATTKAITIAGVGTGTPLKVTNSSGGCLPGIAFKYASDIRSAGLAGDATQIVAGSSSAYVIDPDHLDQVPSETARKWFQEDVASGKIQVIRK
jgi:hypothetical protein